MVLRPLHLTCEGDLRRESERSGIPISSLAQHASEPGRRAFAWTGIPPADRADVLQAVASRNLLMFDAEASFPSNRASAMMPLAGGRTGARSAPVYLTATNAEIVGLLDSLPTRLDQHLELRAASSPCAVSCRRARLLFGPRPLIMGVLNVTPDSFSDGGAYSDPNRATERAWHLAEGGADLVDIGGESTRPGADPVSETVELGRILPVISALGDRFPIPISVDTSKSSVARRALESGADIVNDVTGLRADPAMVEVSAGQGGPLVISHIRGTPKTMQAGPQYGDLMADVASDLAESVSMAVHAGVNRQAIILDPGVGFGKSFEDNLELLRRLPELTGLGHAVLVGVSRKSFLGRILDRPPSQRLEGSLAAAAVALDGGAAILRVHDVEETARFIKTLGAIREWAAHEAGRG